MLLSIIVIGIVVALALFDYFSTKNWQLVTSSERNETVFENRNKKYGAYQIRKDYNSRVLLILLGIVAGTSGLYGASVMFRKDINDNKGGGILIGQVETIDDKKDNEQKEPVKKENDKEQKQEALSKASFFIPPRIVNDSVSSNILPVIPGTEADTSSHEGSTFGNPGGGGHTEFIPPRDTTDENGVPDVITEVAYFVGGRSKMIEFIGNHIRQEVEGSGTTKVKFLVSESGKITKTWIIEKNPDCPDCDKAALDVVKQMPNWVSGKSNGTPVPSYFYLPISFK